MKKTYLSFTQPVKHLPRITSRRMRIGAGRHNIAYKTDAEIAADIETKLTEVKTALETSLETKLTAKAKAEITSQLLVITNQITDLKASIPAADTTSAAKITMLEAD